MSLKPTITIPGSRDIFRFHCLENGQFYVIYNSSFFENVLFSCYINNVHLEVKYRFHFSLNSISFVSSGKKSVYLFLSSLLKRKHM